MWTVIPVHKAFCPYLGLQVEHIFWLCYTCLTSCTELFLRILWHTQSGHHSQNNLAKFGYILDNKSRKKRESFYILGSLVEFNHTNWKIKKKPFQNLANLCQFFPSEILCIGWNHFFKETRLFRLSSLFINQDPCPSSSMFLLASWKFLVWINACWSRRINRTHITCEEYWQFGMAFAHTSRSKLKWPMWWIVL